ncbi:MAG: methionyl-tRNA formyltransferase [Verrucomicrobiales bacterium]
MRLLFIGTGEIGVPALRWLVRDSGHQVAGVVCQPDRPVGRKQILAPPATKVLALENGVPVFQPEKILDAAADLSALQTDIIVVMAYGQFLPRYVREASRLACVNLHASLLPRWRGASPIQAAIAAGDSETGITVMHVAAQMDAGDMILAERTPILPHDTGESLQGRLALLAPKALGRALPLIEAGAPRMAQNPAGVTHCGKLAREDGVIRWAVSAVEIERLVRAFHPWPGTNTRLPDGTRLKIFPPVVVEHGLGSDKAALSHETNIHPQVGRDSVEPGSREFERDKVSPHHLPHPGVPGTVLDAGSGGLLVSAGTDALRILDVQPEARRRMTACEFLSGHPLAPGSRLA